MNSPARCSLTSRRDFLKSSGTAVAATALAGTLGRARPGYCAEDNTIKVALVGCGGRGTGATANALATQGPIQLWAMADVFEHRLSGSLNLLSQRMASQVSVPPERRFVGFDGFKRAIDSLGGNGLVILATPPAFRPIHFEYAADRGVHVFMEKSFAVDAPGIRRVLQAGKVAAEKGLKVAGGLMSRHYRPLEQAVEQIHQGRIGSVITCWAYRMHGPVGFTPKRPGESELAHQIANYSNFTWLNGSFLVDWLIHNIDVCCWVKDAWPESAQAMGGRHVREQPDQLFDHYAAEYSFPDGTRMEAQGRHISGCWDFFGDIIHGATGSAILGEGQLNPRLFKGHKQTAANQIWKYDGPPSDAYQAEHDLLMDAIRNNKTYNETDRCARACMVAIMGRMAVESGKLINYEEALAADLELAPGLGQISSLEDPAPVQPDAEGRYPIAVPGRTEVL